MTVKCNFRQCLCLLAALGAISAGAPARAQTADLAETEFDCVIEPRAVVKLGSAEEGIIREIAVERGDVVRRGDVVARLDSELQTLAVEAARLRAERNVEVRSGRARLEFRQRELDRAQQLFGKSIVSAKVRDEAEIERRLAEFGVRAAEMDRRMARLELANAEARLERRTLRSPVDGVVVERTMSLGEFAHEQSPIMTLAQVHPLNVEVFVPISRYGSIDVGMLGEVMPEPPVSGAYLARVNVLDRVFDTASSTFGLRLALPNPDFALPAGVKCRVRLLPGEGSPDSDIVDDLEYLDVPLIGDAVSADAAATADPDPEAEVAAKPDRARDPLVQQIQVELQRMGYDPGPPDGYMGPLTKSAIAAFQKVQGLPVDGEASVDVLDALRKELARR